MPTPSKFTADTRKAILDALAVGASRRTAAHVAHVDEATLRRWLEQGKTAQPGTRWAEFRAAVEEAEAHPRLRALGAVYNEIPGNPRLAWDFVQRREPGYAPPMPQAPTAPQGPVIIQLALAGGAQLALAEPVIEGEVVEIEQDSLPEPATDTPA